MKISVLLHFTRSGSKIASIFLWIVIYGCSVTPEIKISVVPETFKIEIPFERRSEGIVVDTYWGKDKIKHKLLWDNHSPTWANDAVINSNKSITRSKEYVYRTSTAEGMHIEGEVYVCNYLLLDKLKFKDVPFYKISNEAEGVLGENIISKGVWKIDFDRQLLIFTSSVDSIEDLKEMELLPTKFSKSGIQLDIAFRNQIAKDVEVDFGFNGGVLMPWETFQQVLKRNNDSYTDSMRFSTPAGISITPTTHIVDIITINGRAFRTFISSNQQVQENLIGLGFFNQFKSVVIDYINKAVYYKRR